jgi:glycosyltransferase-like protein
MLAPLDIAMLTHSTNPRGGVVHALEVADALTDLGHRVTVHAPDGTGEGFFRATRCRTVSVPARPVIGGLVELVTTRIEDYVEHFGERGLAGFDIVHAQDGISANALATLRERGAIPGFVRTVHHLDDFREPRLAEWQRRGVDEASRLLCVSPMWRDILLRDHGRRAAIVGNGVDTMRFSPAVSAHDASLAAALGLGGGPIFLAVGGIEQRKNSVRLLEAFVAMCREAPDAQLVIAGGASLLDHGAYRASFDAALVASGVPIGRGQAVIVPGAMADADMPSLYRLADALVFPSVKEGFGLVVLEAMASGTPVVVSRVEPFTGYLASEEVAFVDAHDVDSIAAGMRRAIDPGTARELRSAGLAASRRFAWARCAERHLAAYAGHLAAASEGAHA